MKTLVLGKLEQEILTILWESGEPLTVRNVLEKLKTENAYTTIMTVMSRMEKKGLLNRTADGKSYIYTTCQCKKDYADKQLKSIFESLLETYDDLVITEFVRTVKQNDQKYKLLNECLLNEKLK